MTNFGKVGMTCCRRLVCVCVCVSVCVCWSGCLLVGVYDSGVVCRDVAGWLGLLVTFLKLCMVNARVLKF